NRASRLSDVGTVRFLLTDGLTTPSGASAPAGRPMRTGAIAAAVAAFVVAGLTSTAWWYFRPSPSTPVTRFSIVLPSDQSFSNTGRQFLALSPDGTKIVYTASQRLYVRSMSDLEARPISGIDGGYSVVSPVFSPDGGSVAFY